MKNIQRFLSVVLCLTMLLSFTTPLAYATEAESIAPGVITSYENYFVYSCENAHYKYCAFLDISTGMGSFSIEYANNPDYVFEYYFSLDVNTLAPNSSVFWENLVTDCLANQTSWTEIYIPTAVTVIEGTESEIMPLALEDSVADDMIDWLRTQNGNIAAYTGNAQANTNMGGINLILYENLTYQAGINNTYVVTTTMSIASFIIGYLGQPVVAGFINFFAFLIGGDDIPANTKIREYTMSTRWDRYVKRVSSDTWLNHTQKLLTYEAYYVIQDNVWDVYDSSRSLIYSRSEAYFYSPSSQFTDAYNYYLTL